MTTQHTPGPWLIHGAMLGHRGDIFSPTAKQVTDCHHIARCFAPKPDKEVICELQEIQVRRDAIAIIEANARLIASAPALLEALERIAAPLDCGCVPCRGQCRSQYALRIELEERQDIALAAIASARGVA